MTDPTFWQDNIHSQTKIESFVTQTKTKKNPYLTLVTAYGLKSNQYSGKVQNVVTMDDLIG